MLLGEGGSGRSERVKIFARAARCRRGSRRPTRGAAVCRVLRPKWRGWPAVWTHTAPSGMGFRRGWPGCKRRRAGNRGPLPFTSHSAGAAPGAANVGALRYRCAHCSSSDRMIGACRRRLCVRCRHAPRWPPHRPHPPAGPSLTSAPACALVARPPTRRAPPHNPPLSLPQKPAAMDVERLKKLAGAVRLGSSGEGRTAAGRRGRRQRYQAPLPPHLSKQPAKGR
eukprot:331392-Chlamydomonas_euryale.AAC.4